ncbi:MAG: hypothetical protein ACFB0E_21630 [Leptolyngbyaceae cyanobacterium]
MSVHPIHQCECEDCQTGTGKDSEYHHQLNVLMSCLDERQRRWLAAVEANRIGHGGTQQMHRVTGLDINTIRRGRRELAADLGNCPPERIRAIGGGRKPLAKK